MWQCSHSSGLLIQVITFNALIRGYPNVEVKYSGFKRDRL